MGTHRLWLSFTFHYKRFMPAFPDKLFCPFLCKDLAFAKRRLWDRTVTWWLPPPGLAKVSLTSAKAPCLACHLRAAGSC